MSLCYLTSMPHQWHPRQRLPETLSPCNNAYERSNASNLIHTSSASSIYGSLSTLPGTVGWPQGSPQAGTHDIPGFAAQSRTMEPVPESGSRTVHGYHENLGRTSQGGLQVTASTVTRNSAHKNVSLPLEDEKEMHVEADDDDDLTASDQEDMAEEQNETRTVIEKRADKRRMKRFRRVTWKFP